MLKNLRNRLFRNRPKMRTMFIGDIAHICRPFESKANEWGGMNYKYRVMPGQHVRALDTNIAPPSIVWDEIIMLSKHCGIPAFRVTLDDGYAITCSPKNSIIVADGSNYRRVDLQAENVIGLSVPCLDHTSHAIIDRKIASVENLGANMDMWDVSLKHNTIFLADNHLFVFDTVAVHVPVTRGAIKDVFNMAPSNNLIAEQSGKLVAEPEHAAIVGLYNLSKTSAGRKRINDILPDKYDFNKPATKRDIIDLLQRLALDKGPDAASVINSIRHLGDSVAFERGLSVGISDLKPLKRERDSMLPDLMHELRALPNQGRDQKQLGAVFGKYIDKGNKAMDKHFQETDSDLADIYISKARGSQSQYRDMLFSPVAVTARELAARPIKHSYMEGLTPAEYAIAAHGARIGVLGRSQGTAMPGALGKELLATSNTLVINKTQGASMGEIEVNLKNWDKDDVIDRYASRDILGKNNAIIARKDTPITPKVYQRMKAQNVKDVWVYTPLQSSSTDGGIPAMSYGLNHKGVLPDVGENIGANSSFAIVQPLFMGSMGSFHTGGNLGAKQSAFPRIKQILELTQNIPDKAVLAETGGSVASIKEDGLGGHEVIVNGATHYLQPRLPVLVKPGDKVKRGDALSGGMIDPRDLAELKDLKAAQRYMVDELHSLVPSAKRRALETVVEGITRHAQVTDPGDSSYLPGDVALIATLESQNKNLVNKIKYDYLFKGVNYLPQQTQSWLSKFNFRDIKREFAQDVMSGAETDIHSYEPAPALARGIEFGKGPKGKY